MISWAYEKEIITKAQFRWIRLYIPLDPVPQSWVFEKSSHRFNLVFRINFCFLLRPRRFVKFLFVTCPNPAIIVREFLSINLPASSSSQGRQTGDAIETVGFSLWSGMDSSSLIQGLLLAIGRSSYLLVFWVFLLLRVRRPGWKTSGFRTVWIFKICRTSGPDMISCKSLK